MGTWYLLLNSAVNLKLLFKKSPMAENPIQNAIHNKKVHTNYRKNFDVTEYKKLIDWLWIPHCN